MLRRNVVVPLLEENEIPNSRVLRERSGEGLMSRKADLLSRSSHNPGGNPADLFSWYYSEDRVYPAPGKQVHLKNIWREAN